MKYFFRIVISILVFSFFTPFVIGANVSQNSVETLQEAAYKPEIPEVKYKNNRFEEIYKEALKLYQDKKYSESIVQSLKYFDTTFTNTCKEFDLIIKNYEALENKGKIEVYEVIERFCESIQNSDTDEMKKSNDKVLDLMKKYPNEEILNVFDIIYRVSRKEQNIDFSLIPSFPNLVLFLEVFPSMPKYYGDKGVPVEEEKYSKYQDILDTDFLRKPNALVIVNSNYPGHNDFLQVFEYEEVMGGKGDFKTSYHNAYYILCNNASQEIKGKLFYCLKSLSYEDEYNPQYTSHITRGFYSEKLYTQEENIVALSKLLDSNIVGDFFTQLYNAQEETESIPESIKKSFEIYSGSEIGITREELVAYWEDIISESLGDDICEYVLTHNLGEFISCNDEGITDMTEEDNMELEDTVIEENTALNKEDDSDSGESANKNYIMIGVFVGFVLLFVTFVIFVRRRA